MPVVLESVADPGSEIFVQESAMTRVAELSRRGLVRCGKDPTVPTQYRRWMEEIGFTDVVEKQIFCPMSGWPLEPHDKLLGSFMGLDVSKAVPAMYKLILAGGLPQEEIEPLLDAAVDNLKDPKYRAYTIGKSKTSLISPNRKGIYLTCCAFKLTLFMVANQACLRSRRLRTVTELYLIHECHYMAFGSQCNISVPVLEC